MIADDDDLPPPILACGHVWDGLEPWSAMAVILKETISDPEGLPPFVRCLAGR